MLFLIIPLKQRELKVIVLKFALFLNQLLKVIPLNSILLLDSWCKDYQIIYTNIMYYVKETQFSFHIKLDMYRFLNIFHRRLIFSRIGGNVSSPASRRQV